MGRLVAFPNNAVLKGHCFVSFSNRSILTPAGCGAAQLQYYASERNAS